MQNKPKKAADRMDDSHKTKSENKQVTLVFQSEHRDSGMKKQITKELFWILTSKSGNTTSNPL